MCKPRIIFVVVFRVLLYKQREATVKIYTGYGDGYRENDLHDITVTNVMSSISQSAVMCNAKVNNIILKNIQNKSGTKYNLAYAEGIKTCD